MAGLLAKPREGDGIFSERDVPPERREAFIVNVATSNLEGLGELRVVEINEDYPTLLDEACAVLHRSKVYVLHVDPTCWRLTVATARPARAERSSEALLR